MGEGDQGDLVKVEPADLVLVTEDREILRLRDEIEATRERIRGSLDDLQNEFDDKIDWRRWVGENPYKTAGIAFALGFLWGSG